MKNVLIISTTEEEMLSNVNDGTNRLFINGSEIPSSSWTGTGNYTATVEGHAVTIAKIDSTDGNISLARTGDYTYEMRRRTPSGEVPDITASASVDANTGTPSVNVTKSGTDMNPNFDFAFHNLKGETGATGATGATPNVTASASVDANTGTPAVTVTKTGTAENPNFAFAFQNLKGDAGATITPISHSVSYDLYNKNTEYTVISEWKPPAAGVMFLLVNQAFNRARPSYIRVEKYLDAGVNGNKWIPLSVADQQKDSVGLTGAWLPVMDKVSTSDKYRVICKQSQWDGGGNSNTITLTGFVIT